MKRSFPKRVAIAMPKYGDHALEKSSSKICTHIFIHMYKALFYNITIKLSIVIARPIFGMVLIA